MNKTTATHNSKDVYESYARKLLGYEGYWAKYDRKKKHKMGSICRLGKNKTVVEVISLDRWAKITKLYFLLARRRVIQGETLKLGHRLGVLRARTVARNFKNKQVNFHETKKQPLIEDPITGKMKRAKIIYFNSDTYSRIAWEKARQLPNERIYKFIPSQGTNSRGGFKQEFKAALKADPLLETRYKQFTHELLLD
jgi:hypothetical protein